MYPTPTTSLVLFTPDSIAIRSLAALSKALRKLHPPAAETIIVTASATDGGMETFVSAVHAQRSDVFPRLSGN